MALLWDRDADSAVSRRLLSSIVVSAVSPFHASAALVSLTDFVAALVSCCTSLVRNAGKQRGYDHAQWNHISS